MSRKKNLIIFFIDKILWIISDKKYYTKSYLGLNASIIHAIRWGKKEVLELFQVVIQWTHDLVIW